MTLHDGAAPRITVAIPNYNGARLLRPCLEALQCQTFPDFDVVLVDDGSTDESLALARAVLPSIRLAGWPRNRGITAAFNECVRQCRGEAVALLNNDVEVAPGWLQALWEGLQANPGVGACASKMLFMDRRTINSAGDSFRGNGTPANRGAHEPDGGQYDQPEYVFGACAGAALYRRQLFDEIGWFDERFVGYCEDVDWSFRMQLAGWRCLYVPTAVAYHWGSASGGGALASYRCGRNFINIVLKDVPPAVWRRHWREIILQEAKLAFDALRHSREPAARARLRGQAAGVLDARWTLPDRRRIMRTRRVSDQYIESLLA
ncbi:MAG TPA: glycosyltransferase family 2 protein [Chloroflexota bacterium]|nr:glycosyltransferase family 2 protein [Chloroflexota bacterium]